MADGQGKYSRRMIVLFWLLAIGAIIGFLIYIGQIALLYVLATLVLVVLLVVVGRADLEKADRNSAGFAVKE